jgi:hypothetical protein
LDSSSPAKSSSKLVLALALFVVLALLADVLGLVLLSLGLGPWILYVGAAMTAIVVLPILILMFGPMFI